MYDNLLVDLAAVFPTALVALVGIVIVVYDAFRNDAPEIPWMAAAGLLVALGIELLAIDNPVRAFEGQLYGGGFSA